MLSDPKSSEGDITLLAIGDVHLGVRPSRLPESLSYNDEIDLHSLTPEATLLAVADRAIAKGVDAVLFAGDVVESANARFEALRPLETAVSRLLEAGIPVIAVAGNHDVEALPSLVRKIGGLELLGEGGHWETRVITKAGRPDVEIVGWSFPQRKVTSSPVADLLRNPVTSSNSGSVRIGLLHGDLDASGGNYAPFTTRELADAALDAWLLGHIHKPSLSEGICPDGSGHRGYLGSLVGLDPGESGPHGPWLVRVNAGGRIETQQLVVSPLRWEFLDVGVGEDEQPQDLADRLIDKATGFARTLQDDAPDVLGLRLNLVGATRHYDALQKVIASGDWNNAYFTRSAGKTLVFVDKVFDKLSLALNLKEIAGGDDPPALLARKLLILGSPSEDRSALLVEARQALQELSNNSCWSALNEERDNVDPLCDEELVALLTRSGTAALNELLSQGDAEADAES